MTGKTVLFFVVVSLLSSCSGGGSKIVGKWTLADQSQLCWPIRGATKIEFFNDQTVVYYEVRSDGQERASGIRADYSLVEDNRVKINVQGLLGGTDLLKYELSGDTLRLCNDDMCCNLVRQ